jgi:Leucine-rich repeat (LRR) protein
LGVNRIGMLYSTPVKSFEPLRRLKQLTFLNLSHTGITDKDIPVLEELPALKSLFLMETQVSQKRIVLLKQMMGYAVNIKF